MKRLRNFVYIGLLGLSLFLACVTPVCAETLNYKAYTWILREESVEISDVEGHELGYSNRGGFFAFENGEVATINSVATFDYVKGAGPWLQYVTIKFEDGSTIIFKAQGTSGGGGTAAKGEIYKGTGRFEGIKGTQSGKSKILPYEKGDPGKRGRGYGSGTLEYTLPPK